jgi:hypothetical protein
MRIANSWRNKDYTIRETAIGKVRLQLLNKAQFSKAGIGSAFYWNFNVKRCGIGPIVRSTGDSSVIG